MNNLNASGFYDIKLTKMKPERPTLTIQYITLGYAVMYILFMIGTLNEEEGGLRTPESIGVLSLFVLFLIGFGISWFHKITTGIIFFVWNIGMWIVELFFVEKNGGFGIIAGIPLIILGVFFILKGIEKKRTARPLPGEEMKIALRLLSAIYTSLYIIVIINSFTENPEQYFSGRIPYSLSGLFLLYLTGLILSWNKELIGGIILLIWFLGVQIVFGAESVLYNTSPAPYAAIVILVQGMMYIGYHRNYKTKQKAGLQKS